MVAKNRSKGRVTKETLRELSLTHKQLSDALAELLSKPGTTKSTTDMLKKQIQELERKITHDLSIWLGIGGAK
jgi:hypothetical protein